MTHKIGIVGLGLIGGSIAKALKRASARCSIYALDPNKETLKMATSEGIADFVTDNDYAIFETCEIVFVCTPCSKTVETVKKIFEVVERNAIITDVASVKGNIVKNIPQEVRFIGGHPMAGVENGGYISSRPFLFENAYYVVSPLKNSKLEDIKVVETLIKKMKAIPITVEPFEHDRIVSKISHLPHMVAYALVNTSINSELTRKLAAGGFKDITRIASSDAELWENISFMNRNNIARDIDLLIDQLSLVKTMLIGDWDKQFRAYLNFAKDKRDSLNNLTVGAIDRAFELEVLIEDRIGATNKITSLLAKNKINISNMFIENSREGMRGVLKIRFFDRDDMQKASELLRDKLEFPEKNDIVVINKNK